MIFYFDDFNGGDIISELTSSFTDRLYIGNNGNVGIGTTIPGALFTVGSNAFEVNSSGAVTAGSWTGTSIATAHGGTGAATVTAALSNLVGNPATAVYVISCTSGTSCTNEAASTLLASPGAIGGTTASTGRFTTVTSTQTTGTAPFTVASTTNVANLNAHRRLAARRSASPGTIGGGTAAAATFNDAYGIHFDHVQRPGRFRWLPQMWFSGQNQRDLYKFGRYGLRQHSRTIRLKRDVVTLRTYAALDAIMKTAAHPLSLERRQ